MDAGRVTAVNEIADRYISRDGGAPRAGPSSARLCVSSPEDIRIVAMYLGYSHKDEFRGGVRNPEAWLAFCRIVGLPADEFRRIVTE